MDLFDAIYGRRSIRRYSDKKISSATLEKILSAATQAPSACNVQGWKFIVIDDKKKLKTMVDEGSATFLDKSTVCVLVLYDNRTDNVEYHDYVQSASACIQNMLLAAHALGVGCCWVCHLPSKKKLRSMFNIPYYYDPIACISMGYPAISPKTMPRRQPLKDIVAKNTFSFKTENRGQAKLMAKRLARKAYYKMPLKKKLKKVTDKLEKKFD
jgi:nitroreductase